MNFEEALREVGKHEPCPHNALDTNLGNGKVWARCEDCGKTIQQDSITALREENARFLEALRIIASVGKSTNQAKIQQAIALLQEIS